MYVNFLSTYSDKKSCHTSITLQTSIARFVSDSWASWSFLFAIAVRITGKLLKIEGFGKHRIVFSFMQRFAWLPQGRPQGKQKMKAGVRKNGDFYHAMLCITAVYAVVRCLSVCLSVCLSRSLVAEREETQLQAVYAELKSNVRNDIQAPINSTTSTRS